MKRCSRKLTNPARLVRWRPRFRLVWGLGAVCRPTHACSPSKSRRRAIHRLLSASSVYSCAVLFANLGAQLDLLEDGDYLGFAESGFLHVETPSGGILYLRVVQVFEGTTTIPCSHHSGLDGVLNTILSGAARQLALT